LAGRYAGYWFNSSQPVGGAVLDDGVEDELGDYEEAALEPALDDEYDDYPQDNLEDDNFEADDFGDGDTPFHQEPHAKRQR
jgi:hypothetical protein